jgi:hypothetical protein
MNTQTRANRKLDFLKRSFIRISIIVFVLATAGMIYQTAATESDHRKYPPPGILVNVDGHKMHIYCMGEGSPMVILDHAGGGSSMDWSLIQPKLAEHTPGSAPTTVQVMAGAITIRRRARWSNRSMNCMDCWKVQMKKDHMSLWGILTALV